MPDPRPTFDKIIQAQVEDLRSFDLRASIIVDQILDYTKIRNKGIGKENFVFGLMVGLVLGLLLGQIWL